MVDIQILLSDNLTIHKIILAGLDSAGKTSIYKKMIEGADLEEIKDLSPTKGIERRSQTIMDHKEIGRASCRERV